VGLGVECRCEVIPREGKGALFSVYSMRQASEITATIVSRPLVVRDVNGQRTDDFRTLRREMGMPP
jgi:tRNA1Val (adenine37-N6)-methyltransferase